MEYKDLQKKTSNELEKMLGEERGSLYEIRLKLSVNQLKEIRTVRITKKNIARIQMRINELKREAQTN